MMRVEAVVLAWALTLAASCSPVVLSPPYWQSLRDAVAAEPTACVDITGLHVVAPVDARDLNINLQDDVRIFSRDGSGVLDGAGRVGSIVVRGQLHLENITMRDFWYSAVYLYGTGYLAANGAVFVDNHAQHYGGAFIGRDGAQFDIQNTIFVNNSAGVFGGAVSATPRRGSFRRCRFEGNWADRDPHASTILLGGMPNNEETTVTFWECSFDRIPAPDYFYIYSWGSLWTQDQVTLNVFGTTFRGSSHPIWAHRWDSNVHVRANTLQCGSSCTDWETNTEACSGFTVGIDDVTCLACPACSSCSEGLFRSQTQPTFDAQRDCSVCPAGRYQPLPSDVTSCEACPPGTYVEDDGVDAQSHLSCQECPAGRGAPVGSQCCDGYGLNGGGASCVLCPAGKYAEDSVCIVCTAHQYNAAPGAGNCTACPQGRAIYDDGVHAAAHALEASCGAIVCDDDGHYVPEGSRTCSGCLAGAEADGNGTCRLCDPGWLSEQDSQCTRCPPGKASSRAGGSECDKCAAGTASNVSGASQCDVCGAGLYAGAKSSLACTPCETGLFLEDNGTNTHMHATGLLCRACTMGRFSNGLGSSGCDACAVGRFSGGMGQTECRECLGGTISDTTGSTECVFCPRGEYSGAGTSQCMRCSLLTDANPGDATCGVDTLLVFSLLVCTLAQLLACYPMFWNFRRVIRIEDITQLGNMVQITTFKPHDIYVFAGEKLAAPSPEEGSGMDSPQTPGSLSGHRKRDGLATKVTLAGTGHPGLDGAGDFLARTVDRYRLELRTAHGDPIVGKGIEASMGTLVQPVPYNILNKSFALSRLELPILLRTLALLPVPWLVAFVYSQTEGRSARDIVVVALATLGATLLALVAALWSQWHYGRASTALQKRLQQYRRRVLQDNPSPQKTERGPQRAVRAGDLVEMLYFFNDFIARGSPSRNAYYLDANVTKPMTSPHRLSFAELRGPRWLDFFVSHFWGTPFPHFVDAIQGHAKTVARHTWPSVNYWICFLANNQWDLDSEIGGSDWRQSSFYLSLRSGRCQGTCMVLDQAALPLTRAWCLFEVLQTFRLLHDETPADGSTPAFQGLLFCTEHGVLGLEKRTGYDVSIALGDRIAELKLENARATQAEDEEMIRALVDEEGGMGVMNEFVKKNMAKILDEVKENFAGIADGLNAGLRQSGAGSGGLDRSAAKAGPDNLDGSML